MKLCVLFLIIPLFVFGDGPLSPEAALSTLQTRPGLEIELVAAEPLVMDPIAFDWDAEGRLWVVEMRDYPNGLTWNKPDDPQNVPGGRVKILTDTDHDGKYDKATVFLDNLSYPTGITLWKDGALVTAAPEIFFARDTDGDGKADQRETWYSGFAKSNQQHRVNGLAWGLDNWFHVANGDGGGLIKSMQSRAEVDIRGNDLRIHPVTRDQELLSGRTQCGRYRDDWGNWFGCNNSNPLWHYPLNESFLRRNPLADAPKPNVDVPEVPGAAPVFPASKTVARFNQAYSANRFTSACGPAIYRDTRLGEEFAGNAFICEPVHNLVNRQILSPKGATFSSKRDAGETASEFFASTDNWSRPVSVRTGPDGAIWIADMYRAVIEHPEWIPHDVQLKLDIRAGSDKGRIYRIMKKGSTTDLQMGQPLEELQNTNGTRRDLAHRTLAFSAPDQDLVAGLESILLSGKFPESRIHAFSVLASMEALDEKMVIKALEDSHPEVVRNAIRHRGKEIGSQRLKEALDRHPDNAFLAQEVAGALGFHDDSGPPLAALLTQYHGEPYVAATVLSSVTPKNLAGLLTTLKWQKTDGAVLESLAKMASKWERTDALEILVAVLETGKGETPEPWQAAIMRGGSGNPEIRKQMAGYRSGIMKLINDLAADEASRINAIGLLPVFEKDPDILIGLLSPLTSPKIREAAFQSIRQIAHAETAARLLGRWEEMSQENRTNSLTLILSREAWTKDLLSLLETLKFPAERIDSATRRRLLDSNSPEIKRRSESVFAGAPVKGRNEVLAAHSGVEKIKGDAEAGRTIFAATCVACHRLEEKGNPIGPDLAALTDRSPGSLLTAILDPNRAVEDKFAAYRIEIKSGEQYFAMIESEGGGSISLRSPDGSLQKISRAEIVKIQSSGISLMPEGFESILNDQQLADLIAYLGNLGGEEASEPPLSARIKPDQKGNIVLDGAKCRLTGVGIKFNSEKGVIDSWLSKDDRAEWTILLDRPGKYVVSMESSVEKTGQGNRWQILADGRKILSGEVGESRIIGEVDLSGGDNKIVLKADGEFKNELMRLRVIRFSPLSQ